MSDGATGLRRGVVAGNLLLDLSSPISDTYFPRGGHACQPHWAKGFVTLGRGSVGAMNKPAENVQSSNPSLPRHSLRCYCTLSE